MWITFLLVYGGALPVQQLGHCVSFSILDGNTNTQLKNEGMEPQPGTNTHTTTDRGRDIGKRGGGDRRLMGGGQAQLYVNVN